MQYLRGGVNMHHWFLSNLHNKLFKYVHWDIDCSKNHAKLIRHFLRRSSKSQSWNTDAEWHKVKEQLNEWKLNFVSKLILCRRTEKKYRQHKRDDRSPREDRKKKIIPSKLIKGCWKRYNLENKEISYIGLN